MIGHGDMVGCSYGAGQCFTDGYVVIQGMMEKEEGSI